MHIEQYSSFEFLFIGVRQSWQYFIACSSCYTILRVIRNALTANYTNTFDILLPCFVMIIDENSMVEILNDLDDFMDELIEQQNFTDWGEMQNFLDAEYESRLADILRAKSIDRDGLESGVKDKITKRKARLFAHVKQAFQKREI